MTVTGKPVRGFLRRYVFRHVRRAGLKTMLTLLLAALLVGAVGELTVLRSRYGEMLDNVRVQACFYDGLTISRAEKLMETGLFSDPVYLKSYNTDLERGELELLPSDVVFTNRLDSIVSDPVTWLEGWDEASAMKERGKVCILPAPVMEQLGIALGDEVRINEVACIDLLERGHDFYPTTYEGKVALRDKYRSFYTVIGRVETTKEAFVIYAPVTAFSTYFFFGTTLYLDSAAFTLNDYRDADKVQALAAEIQYTAKKPPVLPHLSADRDLVPFDHGGCPHSGDASARAHDPAGAEGGGHFAGFGLVEEADAAPPHPGAGTPVPGRAGAGRRRPLRGERQRLPGGDPDTRFVCRSPLRPMRSGQRRHLRLHIAPKPHAPAADEGIKKHRRGNAAAAGTPHPPLRGTFPRGKAIAAARRETS